MPKYWSAEADTVIIVDYGHVYPKIKPMEINSLKRKKHRKIMRNPSICQRITSWIISRSV